MYVSGTGGLFKRVCMYVCMYVSGSNHVCMSQVAKHVCMSQGAKHVCMYVCLEPPEVPSHKSSKIELSFKY